MLKNYLIMAFKVLLRRKFFTMISLACISTTLAILMVAATIVDNFIGNVPPETKKDRTLFVYFVATKYRGEAYHQFSHSPPAYEFLSKFVDIKTLPNIETASIATTFASDTPGTEAISEDVSVHVDMKKTDGNYWKILEYDFIEGGPLTEEDMTDANYVTVINQSTRKKLFGAGPAIDRSITLDGLRYRVKGVVKDVSSLQLDAYSEAWIPISTSKTKAYLSDGYRGQYMGIILARSRDDFPLIKSEYLSRVKELPLPDGVIEIRSSPRKPLEYFAEIFLAISGTVSDEDLSGMIFMILTIVVILFLTLPVINIININLCRMDERASEIGVRKAFGASSIVLIGQFVAENFILTLIGGILGVFVSIGTIHILNATGMGSFFFHYRMFLVGLTAIFGFNLLSGGYPAWRMSRFHPVNALRMNA
ncbi:MAG: ABC transporter permease [Desulfobacteraceae bacterium]|jgi:putative ABC transport system permease protein